MSDGTSTKDEYRFDIGDMTCVMENAEPSKRSVIILTAKFFDPLHVGVVSPVTILFKMFCKQLCEANVGWNEPLSENLLETWDRLLGMLRGARAIVIPWCVYQSDGFSCLTILVFLLLGRDLILTSFLHTFIHQTHP